MRTEVPSFLPLCLAAAGHFPKSKPELVQWYHFPLQNRELSLQNNEPPPG